MHVAKFKGRSGASARGGFSLLETMIAISVLMVAVLSAVSSQVTSVNLLRTNRESNAAMTDLETAMEGLLVEGGPQDILDAFPDGVEIDPFAGLNLANETITPTYPGLAGGGAAPSLLEIVLDITWTDWRGRPRTLQLATMRAGI